MLVSWSSCDEFPHKVASHELDSVCPGRLELWTQGAGGVRPYSGSSKGGGFLPFPAPNTRGAPGAPGTPGSLGW